MKLDIQLANCMRPLSRHVKEETAWLMGKQLNPIMKWLLFRKIMASQPRGALVNSANGKKQAYVWIDNMFVYAVHADILQHGYIVEITDRNMHKHNFKGQRAKKIFEHVTNAAQNQK